MFNKVTKSKKQGYKKLKKTKTVTTKECNNFPRTQKKEEKGAYIRLNKQLIILIFRELGEFQENKTDNVSNNERIQRTILKSIGK